MSKFWERKMRTYFRTFDIDKDGYISEEDFANVARYFADSHNASQERKENLVKILVNLWKMYMKAGDIKKDPRLTASILTESVKQQYSDPKLKHAATNLMRSLFELVDEEKLGYLQAEDHKQMFRGMGVPEGAEKRAFEAMDANNDGKISVDEFTASGLDFLFSHDEKNPNNYFFGPLVD